MRGFQKKKSANGAEVMSVNPMASFVLCEHIHHREKPILQRRGGSASQWEVGLGGQLRAGTEKEGGKGRTETIMGGDEVRGVLLVCQRG